MFEYLPELMKGATHQPDANRCLADCGTDSGIDFYHHPDAENAGAGVAGTGLYHAVYRYAAAGADLPDLLRPGQFPTLQEYPALWHLLSEPWLCALIALSLNSAAYTTQLFYGAIRAIPEGQWQSCSALGMSKKDTLAILLPYAFKRSLSSYSNEVVLVFKSTSLAYTITLMEVMGYSQLLYGRTYDVMVFGAAGIIYLVVNGLLTLMMRLIERKALAFERRN